VTNHEDFNRLVRRSASLSVACVAGLVFGTIQLAGGDWIPGGVIVAASLVGLAVQIPGIRRLGSERPAPSPPRSTPTGSDHPYHPPTPHR
jgi:hypothetical protein